MQIYVFGEPLIANDIQSVDLGINGINFMGVPADFYPARLPFDRILGEGSFEFAPHLISIS